MTGGDDSPVVRPGAASDVRFVVECIRALAEFERLLDHVQASPEALAEHLFGAHPSCELLIAEAGGKRCGYALYFTTYSTFLTKPGLFLEDLFVLERVRGRGVGKALLVELARIAVERGCGRLEWSVLDWNRRAIDFYDSLGARPVSGWIPYRLDGSALANLAAAPRATVAKA
jgi:GNAT superfamily N-acetyltransferase